MDVNPIDTPTDAPEETGARQAAFSADAGTDESIADRLQRNPESKEARLDRALDESMDASDPPASTQPIHSHSAPASSGYNPQEEAKLAAAKAGQNEESGLIGKIARKLGLD